MTCLVTATRITKAHRTQIPKHRLYDRNQPCRQFCLSTSHDFYAACPESQSDRRPWTQSDLFPLASNCTGLRSSQAPSHRIPGLKSHQQRTCNWDVDGRTFIRSTANNHEKLPCIQANTPSSLPQDGRQIIAHLVHAWEVTFDISDTLIVLFTYLLTYCELQYAYTLLQNLATEPDFGGINLLKIAGTRFV